MAALFCASEEGNVDGLKELSEMANNIDLSTANKVSAWSAEELYRLLHKRAVNFNGVAYLSLKKRKKKRWLMKSYGLPKWIYLKCKIKSSVFFLLLSLIKVWSEKKVGLQLGF